MRDTRGVNRLRELWRWSLSPAGEREQLVLFNHGKQGEAPDREVGYYDGEEVSREQYTELDEDTGLRHTLEIGGKMVNGIHGATGMQYANTSRSGAEANNASFARTAVVKVSTAGGVIKGQPVLLFAHTRSEGGHKAWGKKGAWASHTDAQGSTQGMGPGEGQDRAAGQSCRYIRGMGEQGSTMRGWACTDAKGGGAQRRGRAERCRRPGETAYTSRGQDTK